MAVATTLRVASSSIGFVNLLKCSVSRQLIVLKQIIVEN